MGLKNKNKYSLSKHFKVRLEQRFGVMSHHEFEKKLGYILDSINLRWKKGSIHYYTSDTYVVIADATKFQLVTIYPNCKYETLEEAEQGLTCSEVIELYENPDFIEIKKQEEEMKNKVLEENELQKAKALSISEIVPEEYQTQICSALLKIANQALENDKIEIIENINEMIGILSNEMQIQDMKHLEKLTKDLLQSVTKCLTRYEAIASHKYVVQLLDPA